MNEITCYGSLRKFGTTTTAPKSKKLQSDTSTPETKIISTHFTKEPSAFQSHHFHGTEIDVATAKPLGFSLHDPRYLRVDNRRKLPELGLGGDIEKP